MKSFSLFIIISIFFINFLNASSPYEKGLTKKDTNGSFLISFVPHVMIANGFRFDLEKRLCKNHWLIVSPVLYTTLRSEYNSYNSSTNDQENVKNLSISGFGVIISHKIFFGKNQSCKGMYGSYGFKYNSVSLKYQNYAWTKYIDNGLEYYGWKLADIKEDISNYGLDIVVGSQNFIFKKIVFLDIYAGIGLQLAKVKLEGTQKSSFSGLMWHYGFEGPHPVIGLRLGALIY